MPKTSEYDIYVKILEVHADIVKRIEKSKAISDGEKTESSKALSPQVVNIIKKMEGDAIFQNAPSGDKFENIKDSVIATKDSIAVGIFEQLTESFGKAKLKADSNLDIEESEREEIKQNLSSLENELKKKEPDMSKAHRCWNWLKKNANWLVPEISKIVQEIIKSHFS